MIKLIPLWIFLSSNPITWEIKNTGIFHVTVPEKILIDSEGHIFVPRVREGSFAHFGPTGTFLGNLGAQGEGPGEFRLALQLFCGDQPQTYFALGPMNAGKVHRFARDGRFLGSIQLPRGVPFAFKLKGGWLYPLSERDGPQGIRSQLLLADSHFQDPTVLLQLPKRSVKTKDPDQLRRLDRPLFRINRRQDRIFVYLPQKKYLEINIIDPRFPLKRHRFTSTDKPRIADDDQRLYPHIKMMRTGPQDTVILETSHHFQDSQAMPIVINGNGILVRPANRADTLFRLIDIRGSWAWIMNINQGELGLAKVRVDHIDVYTARNPLSD